MLGGMRGRTLYFIDFPFCFNEKSWFNKTYKVIVSHCVPGEREVVRFISLI